MGDEDGLLPGCGRGGEWQILDVFCGRNNRSRRQTVLRQKIKGGVKDTAKFVGLSA